MPRGIPKSANLAAIDKGISELKGIISNLNGRVQSLAVAIVTHAFGTGEGQGSGDVSRAPKLVNALPNSFRREYLIRWFRAAGIGLNMKDNKVSVIQKGARDFKSPPERIDFANNNNWFDAVDKNGDRAPWYQGPTPAQFEPNTMGDLGQNIINFTERYLGKDGKPGQLDATKTVGDREVPLYSLTPEQRATAERDLAAMRRLGLLLMANETREHHEAEIVKLDDFIGQSAALVEAVNGTVEADTTVEARESVAG